MALRSKIDSDYKAVLRLFDNDEVGNYPVPASAIASLLREYGSHVSRDVLAFLAKLSDRTTAQRSRTRGTRLGRIARSTPDASIASASGNGAAETRLPESITETAPPTPTPKALSLIVDCSTNMQATWDDVKHSVVTEVAVARYNGPVRLSLRLVASKENWMFKFSKEADRIPDSVKCEDGSAIIDAIGHEVDAVNNFMVQNPSYKDNSEMLIYTVGKDTSSKEYKPVSRLGMVVDAAKKRGFKIRVMHQGAKVFADKIGLEVDPKAVREAGSATLLVQKISQVRK